LTQDVAGIGGLSGDSLPYTPKWARASSKDWAWIDQPPRH
jgi:hypothetical protein